MSESEATEARPAATTRPVHGTIGSLEAFDPKTDTVAAYAKRAELYMDANDMPEARRVATFLNCIGKTMYAIIRNLMIPDKPAEKSLKDIIAVMEKHFEPKPWSYPKDSSSTNAYNSRPKQYLSTLQS